MASSEVESVPSSTKEEEKKETLSPAVEAVSVESTTTDDAAAAGEKEKNNEEQEQQQEDDKQREKSSENDDAPNSNAPPSAEKGEEKVEILQQSGDATVAVVDADKEESGKKKEEEGDGGGGGGGGGGGETRKMTPPAGDAAQQQQQRQQMTANPADGVPKELLVKHPLQYRWVLWYCKQDRNKHWEECLKQVAAFDTVEDFWALYNHIQLASGLSFGSDYYLFKEGIRPMWEDAHNIEGGRWLIQVDKNRRAELLDHYWLELLMAVIGEQFDDNGEQICGLVVNIRQKGDKISLWTRDATKDEANKRIGSIAKQKLDIGDSISYEQHKDTSHKNSSMVKPKLRV